jgi:hypothetical protein
LRTQPTVHIACAIDGTASDSSLGVFDLTDPASAFALAQFVLGLDVHFRTIVSATSHPQMCPLGWRSDHIAIDDQKIDGEQWKSSVERWACAVDMCYSSRRDVCCYVRECYLYPFTGSSDESSFLTPAPHELAPTLPVSLSTSMPGPKSGCVRRACWSGYPSHINDSADLKRQGGLRLGAQMI